MTAFSVMIYIFINIQFFTSTTYAAEIWNEPMDTGILNPGGNWIDDPLNTALILRSGDGGCAQAATGGSGVDECWAICTGSGQSGEPTVYRDASTIGFKNIELTFDLDPWANSPDDDHRMCVIEYSTNNGIAYGPLFSTTLGNEHIQGTTVALGFDADEAASVRIRVRQVNANGGTHGSDCGIGCYISNFILSGQIVTNPPTADPTADPTRDPTTDPTADPTTDPTADPTADPTTDPTADPTTDPTADPTADPTTDPTDDPTTDPTNDPTNDPTTDPTADPTADPTNDPTNDPTSDPTNDPTSDPTNDPTSDPTSDPTNDPTNDPTSDPTADPTADPTSDPTSDPTKEPTKSPINDIDECGIGDRCNKRNDCCPNGISERELGVDCQKNEYNKRFCCILEWYPGCQIDNDCCDEGICDNNGYCVEDIAPPVGKCRINKKCDQTEDCCGGNIWERDLGITCTSTYKYSKQKGDRGCCIKIGFECENDIECCNERGRCYQGECKNKQNIPKEHRAWDNLEAIDNEIYEIMDEVERDFSVSEIIIGILLIMIIIAGMCWICMRCCRKCRKKREMKIEDATDDELSSLANVIESNV